ncbi:T9SS type A sorting domain-containing protein [Luteibaculum oceani]|uniref:T9SS type A sorting domain-containing protein n=1 Tax=Luteibaculum oceani TaxID=1294296 RepID=A0A5C6V9A5_9FLAO|nr:T9SS type A sorting domain-containing protein [Luteibaculum oceani]TXC82033.1 T9SS type A sorting domain-containing protein [Luteibaculum oceani]
MNRLFFILTILFSINNVYGQPFELQRVNELQFLDVREVVKDDSGDLWAATGGGVYFSDNNGDSWELINDGLQLLGTDDYRTTNSIKDIWHTSHGLFLLTDSGVLFKRNKDYWSPYFQNYEVFDFVEWNGQLYIAAAEINSSNQRFYRAEIFRPDFSYNTLYNAFEYTAHFNAGTDIFHPFPDGLILIDEYSVFSYKNDSLELLFRLSTLDDIQDVAGRNTLDFYFLSDDYTQNFFHYKYGEVDTIRPGGEEFAGTELFRFQGDIFVHGKDGLNGWVKTAKLYKQHNILGQQTWVETGPHEQVVPPKYYKILGLNNGEFLYCAKDQLMSGNSVLVGPTQRKGANIFNGDVDGMAIQNNDFYILHNGKIMGRNLNNGDSIPTPTLDENERVSNLKNSGDDIWAYRIDREFHSWFLRDYFVNIFSKMPEGVWRRRQNPEINYSKYFNFLGAGDGALNYRDYGYFNPFEYWVYDFNTNSFSTEPWGEDTTRMVDLVARVNGYEFLLVYDIDYSSANPFVNKTYWSIRYKSALDTWTDLEYSRNNLGSDWDYFREFVQTDEGDVLLIYYRKDPSTPVATIVEKFNFQAGAFEFYKSIPKDFDPKELEYSNGLWFYHENDEDFFSFDLENWYTYDFQNLPIGAKVTLLKKHGNTLYVGTEGNGVYRYQLSPTKVLENQKDFMLAIYPNPVSDMVNIKAEKRLLSYQIISVDGKVSQQGRFDVQSSVQKINVSGLSPGSYILQLQTKNGARATSKLLVE